MARLEAITSKDQLAPKDHAVFDSIVASRGAVHGPFAMFLHSPDIAGSMCARGIVPRHQQHAPWLIEWIHRQYEAIGRGGSGNCAT